MWEALSNVLTVCCVSFPRVSLVYTQQIHPSGYQGQFFLLVSVSVNGSITLLLNFTWSKINKWESTFSPLRQGTYDRWCTYPPKLNLGNQQIYWAFLQSMGDYKTSAPIRVSGQHKWWLLHSCMESSLQLTSHPLQMLPRSHAAGV